MSQSAGMIGKGNGLKRYARGKRMNRRINSETKFHVALVSRIVRRLSCRLDVLVKVAYTLDHGKAWIFGEPRIIGRPLT